MQTHAHACLVAVPRFIFTKVPTRPKTAITIWWVSSCSQMLKSDYDTGGFNYDTPQISHYDMVGQSMFKNAKKLEAIALCLAELLARMDVPNRDLCHVDACLVAVPCFIFTKVPTRRKPLRYGGSGDVQKCKRNFKRLR